MPPQPTSRLDDASIVRASLVQPERLAELYDRHAAAIHRYAARRLGSRLADDVLAETFLAAFRRRSAYDLSRPDARPWLYGIAVKVIGKHRRSELRMLRALARTGRDPVLEGHAERANERLAAAALRRQAAGALAALAAEDRNVLLLIAWSELSYEETAAALHIPVGTVCSRLARARRKLRSALGNRNPVSFDQQGALL